MLLYMLLVCSTTTRSLTLRRECVAAQWDCQLNCQLRSQQMLMMLWRGLIPKSADYDYVMAGPMNKPAQWDSSAPAVDGSVPMRRHILIRELCAVLQKKNAVQVTLMSLTTTTTTTTTTATPGSPLSIGNKSAND